MNLYRVSADEYYHNIDVSRGSQREQFSECFSFFESIETTSKQMTELIRKYSMEGKSVLSIGPAFGHEEYHYYRKGCALTFVDIDSYNVIEPYLRTLTPSTDQNSSLEYYVGDVREFLEMSDDRKFDVVHIAGFTPDESRRKSIKEGYNGGIKKAINFVPKKLLGKAAFAEWPKDQSPYADIIQELGDRALSTGGLLVLKTFAWGINIRANRYYALLVRDQLRSIGVELLRIYYPVRNPSVQLAIGRKCSRHEAEEFLKARDSLPDVSSLNGRRENNSSVARAFDLLD